jgi:hypothetical protein
VVDGNVTFRPPFFMEEDTPHWPLPPGLYRVGLFKDDDDTQPMGQDFVLVVVAAENTTVFALVALIVLLAIAALGLIAGAAVAYLIAGSLR